MKTISMRFLKGALAIVLVVMMLFSSTISGFAAVVDNAQTSVNAGDCIWFNNTPNWSQPYVYIWNGASGSNYPGDKMTYDDDSGLWYFQPNTKPSGAFNCIFNPGNDNGKTGDLSCPGIGQSYDYSTGTWSAVAVDDDNTETGLSDELISVLKGEKIMFYIGEPQGWNQSTFYLRNGAGGSTVDSGSYVITSDSKRYAVVTAPAETGYYVSHSTSWNGEAISGTPASGKGYVCDDSTTNGTCDAYGSAYSIKATLSSNSIIEGTDVGASSTWSPTNANFGQSFKIQYYYTADNATFYNLPITSTSDGLVTSGLDVGSYYVYPVLFDGYVYTRGEVIPLTVEAAVTDVTATFVDYNGTTVLDTSTVQSGDTPSYTGPTPTREGYTFTGWKSDVDNKTYTTSELPAITADTTFTAQFTLNSYTLTINETGATGTVKVDSATAGSTITHGSHTVSITPPTGYKISSVSVNGTSKGTNLTSYSETLDVTGNVTINVVYEVIKTTITFNKDGGTGGTDSIEATYGETLPNITPPTKTGYTFAGYYSDGQQCYDANGNGLEVCKVTTATYTLTAKWEINSYTLTLNGNNTLCTFEVDGSEYKTYEVVPLNHGTYDVTVKSAWDEAGWVIKDIKINDVSSPDFTDTGYVTEATISVDVHADTTVSVEFEQRGKNVYFYNNGNTSENEGNCWVQANSTVTPPETIEVEGYTFLGWYVDDVKVEDFSTYTITAVQTCFTAKYEQITYDLTVIVPDGVASVYVGCSLSEFANVTIYGDTTISDIPYGAEFYVVAYPKDTYRLDGWLTDNADVTITNSTRANLYSDLTVTPDVTRVYDVYVDGVAQDVKYAYTQNVTINYPLEANQYIDYITVTDIDGNTVQLSNQIIDKNNGTITFDMPEHDVYIAVTLGTKYSVAFGDDAGLTINNNLGYYIPGEAVSITVSSSTGVLNSVTASGGISQTFTPNSNGVCTVTFTMPSADVTLTADLSQKLAVSVKTIVYNPFGTAPSSTNFTVDTTGIDEDGYTSGKITLNASINSNYTTEYSFIGYYSDSAYTECIGVNNNTTYTVTEDNTTIYAVFAKNVYLPNSVSNEWSHVPMAFDPSTNLYSEIINDDTVTFKLEAISGSWDRPSTTTFSSGNNVTFTDNGTDNSVASVNDSTTYKAMTIYFKATTIGSAYQLYGVASTELIDVPDRYTVYLSSGNVSLNGTYDTDIFDSESVITTQDNNIKSSNESSISHESRVNEKYIKYTINGEMEIEFQTTLSGTSAETYYIYKYLIYGIDSGVYLDVVSPSEDTTNVFTASHYVTEDCYIVPVFFRTQEYYDTTEGVKELEFFFDAKDIKSTDWGPFVSVYMYGTDGTNEVKLNGGWPGQLMVPTADGKSYYVSIEVPNGVSPQGITFCNYMEFSVPASFFAVSGKQQTYDYREGITLTEQGIDSIYFRAKPGDTKKQHNGATLTPSITLSEYQFEYLKDFNDTYLMNFHGQSMKDVEYDDSSVSADYYIVAKGNVDYNVNTTNTYEYEGTYKGQWSVDWYVYDSDGKYITHSLSDAFYHNDEYSAEGTDTTAELLELIMQAEEKTDESYYNDKKIAISYEQINDTRYDGQWYGGNNLESDAYAYVGLADVDGNFTFDDMLTTNDESFGTGYVVDANGNETQHAVIPSDPGTVTLRAVPKDDYIFVGWYTFDKDGNASKITSNLVKEDEDLNFSESFYAVFRPVGENELIVFHDIYNNDDRSSGVPSHGGRAKLKVEVTKPDKTTVSGPYSSNGSSVSLPVTEGETYTITITTDPTGIDKFYAWYMGTTDVAGNVAYEEVLMDDPTVIGSTDEVTASFTYTYNPKYKNNIIRLYSDMDLISVNAKYVYQYKDRFGDIKYYTVTSELNGNELEGYAGNGGIPYYPTYITVYTLYDANGGVIGDPIYGEDNFNAVDKSTYSTYTSYNAVQKNAPSSKVTQAYDMDIEWVITRQYMTDLKESYVLLEAVVSDSTYTIEYTIPGNSPETQTIDDLEYNYLLHNEIIAPETYDGKEFSYWQEYTYDENDEIVDGEILCYTTAYNYRVTENKCIKAVYGEEVTLWTPVIDSVTYTREKSDSGDYVYTDYLISYTSAEGKILDELKASDASISYGLIAVRNSSYVYTEAQYTAKEAISYPIDREDQEYFEKYVKAVAGYGVNKAFKSEDQTVQYNAYCYDLTERETTDFNRLDYYLKYDLANTNQKGYAFTCYAYLIIDGETYISSPVNTCIANSAYAPVN